ncbi:MAG: 3'-5' exoribonuclease [Clostridia bacterium]|nr:3'-5' exoribonuclease [Clostridia bacterium]
MKKLLRLTLGIPMLMIAVLFEIATISLAIEGDIIAAAFCFMMAGALGYAGISLIAKKDKPQQQVAAQQITAITPPLAPEVKPAEEAAPSTSEPEAKAQPNQCEDMAFDFVAIDFETAYNANHSACSIGIACVKDLQIVKTEYYLIKPPSLEFGARNIEINGITPQMVENEPQFPAIWRQIDRYFGGSCPVIAHNAQFDMSVLHECLAFYALDKPEVTYYDSIAISSKVCDDVGSSLAERAAYFGVDMGAHHNALDDVKTCAAIVIRSVESVGSSSLAAYLKRFYSIRSRSFADLKPQKFFEKPVYTKAPSPKTVSATEPIDTDSVFFGKNVVISGEFEKYTRADLTQMFVNRGASVRSSAVRSLNYLILGKQDPFVVGADGKSSKERRVEDLIAQGFDIKIVREDELEQLLHK